MKNSFSKLLLWLQKHERLAAFVAGGVSVLAFAPRFWTVFAFVAYSFLMYLIVNTPKKSGLFKVGYAFGFAHFAFGFAWVGNALLVEADKFGWLYPITLIASGAFFGLFFAVPSLVTFLAKTNWQKWLVFSSAFVILEWIRSFIFTGFPWNLTGYTLAFSDELIQLASVGGSYLLSLVVMLMYSSFGVFAGKYSLRVVSFIGISFLIMWAGGYYRISSFNFEDSDTVVRLVQPSIPQSMKWSRILREQNFIEYVSLSNEKNKKVPDFIVWGETASPFVLDRDEYHRNMLKPVLKKGSYLITGMLSYEQDKEDFIAYNSMVVFDPEVNPAGYYHKTHLVPFGEYIPFRKYLPDFISPVANVIGEFGKGKGPEVFKFDELPSFGGIICYEAIFPREVVDTDNKPDFLVNITNDGWYGNSAGPYQHWVATKMRAVEEGIEVVRVANNGISGVINALGIEKKKIGLNKKGFIDVNLDKILSVDTIYSRFGNWVVLSFCLILMFFGVINPEYRNSFFYERCKHE